MKTMPNVGDIVYLICDREYVLALEVLYVTQHTYVSLFDSTPHIPADRQLALLYDRNRMDHSLVEVSKLFATKREATLVLVQNLRQSMDTTQKRFDDAYREMITDAKQEQMT